MIVRELLTKLGYQVDESKLKKFNDATLKAKRRMKLATIAVVAMGTAFLKKAGEMEQVEIAFETMTGSAVVAQKLLEDLATFAAQTPFELTGLIQSSKKLLAFGFTADEIVDKMRNIGNIAAGIGRDKLPSIILGFGKIRTKGKATMEELNIMLEAGVPILDELAKNAGVSTEAIIKMVSQGAIKFKDVDKALYTLSNGTGKFANLMIKQSKSFLGLISNVGDFFEMFIIGVGKELLPQAKELTTELINWLQANRELVKQNLVSFFKGVLTVIKDVTDFIGRMIKFTGGLNNFVKAILLLGVALKATFAIIAFMKFIPVMKGIIAALNITTASTWAMNTAIAFIPILILAAMALLALIAEDLYQFFTGGESLTGDFVNTFKAGWLFISQTVKTIWDKITSTLRRGVTAIVTFFKKIPGEAVAVFLGIGSEIKAFFISIIDWVKNKIDSFFQVISKTFTKVRDFFKGLFDDEEKKLKIKAEAEVGTMKTPTFNPAAFSKLTGVEMSPGKIARGEVVNQKSTKIDVKSNVTMQMPEGTTEQQKKVINDFATKTFSDVFRKELNVLDLNNPLME